MAVGLATPATYGLSCSPALRLFWLRVCVKPRLTPWTNPRVNRIDTSTVGAGDSGLKVRHSRAFLCSVDCRVNEQMDDVLNEEDHYFRLLGAEGLVRSSDISHSSRSPLFWRNNRQGYAADYNEHHEVATRCSWGQHRKGRIVGRVINGYGLTFAMTTSKFLCLTLR